MPDGTTSFYFRTRKALVQAIAERLTELDLADLSLLTSMT
ncbi:TetR family transcriptional regulator, partial [Mycobacterium sp. ITM-2017-0098]